MNTMAANSTLLCIHRDPAQLSFLQENGYELVTAANGQEGLRLFMSRPVDALVAKADGPHFLLATVHFVLNAKTRARAQRKPKRSNRTRASSPDDPFSAEVWNGIRDGTVKF